MDELKSDQAIINHIEVLIIKRVDDKKRIRDLRKETDELSLLHLAAQHCRPQLCNYLIDTIRIGNFFLLNKKLIYIFAFFSGLFR